ncbi:MerR family transcriptional regulator [Anaerolentibacter hominis]|uniref:MerR family transcriptional regulator n=1 Tax=Anaerolentibacter hominis TaxID=3079009 RepID=UPI0031B882B0
MTVKEAEEKTGLARSNIRYYEKEGLLFPGRNEKNGYRDYSEEDIRQLQKIAFLRTLGVTVEDIREISTGGRNLRAVIQKQNERLEAELDGLIHNKAIMQKILQEKDITFDCLNVEAYTAVPESYIRTNRELLRLDAVSFFYCWGGLFIWLLITVLSVLAALLSVGVLPEQIPVQWSGGEGVTLVSRWFIFAYAVACPVIRYLLRPALGSFLFRNFQLACTDTVTDYISNFLCFVALTIQVFTILFVFRLVRNIAAVLVLDGIVFGVLLILGYRSILGEKA